MTLEQMVETVKKTIFNTPSIAEEAKDAQVFEEVKLKDGTAMEVSEMAPGATAEINDAPAPAGDYETEDGTIIKVGEGGIISEIIQAPADVAPEGEMMNAEPKQDFSEQFAAIEEKFSAYEVRFAKAEEVINKQQEALKEMFGLVEKLAAIPAGDPAEAPKSNFAAQKVDSRKDAVAKLAEAARKYKAKAN